MEILFESIVLSLLNLNTQKKEYSIYMAINNSYFYETLIFD